MASNIADLPKELLALIFENLTEANDRRRIAQVSKLFYEIVRHQSTLKHNNGLQMIGSDSDKSPIRVFENSNFFPFSKVSTTTRNWHRNITLESAFWSLHGEKISEIDLFSVETVAIETFLPVLNNYFPNLKKLGIKYRFSEFSDDDNSHATTFHSLELGVSLPIEDLSLDHWNISLDQTLTLLRCSSLLKNLQIKLHKVDYLPEILPWLETVESCRLNFNRAKIPLEKLINLPSKVVIDELIINVDQTPKMIREFFKRPRTIETLLLCNNYDYDEFDEEDENTPDFVFFNRDQAIALSGVKSIKYIDLPHGALRFEGSMDLLAKLPGLESISLDIGVDLSKSLYPYYWSSPETAQRIRKIVCIKASKLYHLAGLSSLTSIDIYHHGGWMPCGLYNDEIQYLICNCPDLKRLFVRVIFATDADLIGDGSLLPFSSLDKLEYLNIGSAENITSKAFKSAFKFPNLKSFTLWDHESFKKKPFNKNVAKHFTKNCPNLEYLKIDDCPINEGGLDYLIRNLPYLREICIRSIHGTRHSVSKDKIEELKKEFPYIKMIFE